ncbi:GH39 family glycosyl hydrolase [Paenibacillus jilunlii]|uniref:GH39 family glycosyl hydrolase n=1 Tax=Paenibacillus jilunlii TaxID=682956 RepID=UPI003CC6DD40
MNPSGSRLCSLSFPARTGRSGSPNRPPASGQHLIQRYGLEEVRSWLFCVWNEPSSSNLLFGFSHDDILIICTRTPIQP